MFYGEDERLKLEYMNLVNEIKNLPIDPQKSYEDIKMVLDSDNEILEKGAPDPHEWWAGREVNIDFTHWKDYFDDEEIKKNNSRLLTFGSLSGKEKRDVARNSDSATLTAHLHYCST